MKKVAVIMGSESDLPVVKSCIVFLKSFGIPVDVHIMSAHRTPDAAIQLSVDAINNGYGVIIAAAGKAAHLAGIIAAHTTLPVIGIPIKSSTLDGLDSLLSTVQMPKGVPVATVAIDGADNAGILAAQILALSEPQLSLKLIEMKKKMSEEVIKKDMQIQMEVNKL
jgi:5-(carboxyamino)imidazole ribonucleotide mutase